MSSTGSGSPCRRARRGGAPTCGRVVERMPAVAETPCAPPIAVVLEGCEASLTHGRLELLREQFCTCVRNSQSQSRVERNVNYGSNALPRRRFSALGHTLCVVRSRPEHPPINRGDALTRTLGRILIDGVTPAAQPQVAEETTVGARSFLGPRTRGRRAHISLKAPRNQSGLRPPQGCPRVISKPQD